MKNRIFPPANCISRYRFFAAAAVASCAEFFQLFTSFSISIHTSSLLPSFFSHIRDALFDKYYFLLLSFFFIISSHTQLDSVLLFASSALFSCIYNWTIYIFNAASFFLWEGKLSARWMNSFYCSASFFYMKWNVVFVFDRDCCFWFFFLLSHSTTLINNCRPAAFKRIICLHQAVTIDFIAFTLWEWRRVGYAFIENEWAWGWQRWLNIKRMSWNGNLKS